MLLNHSGHSDHSEKDDSRSINRITDQILDCAFLIYRKFGPGLLESAYEHLMFHDIIKNKKLKAEHQKTLSIEHDGILIDAGYRLDLIVEDCVIVELKAVEKIIPLHVAQLLTYLRLSQKKVGLIINFNARLLRGGVKRLVL